MRTKECNSEPVRNNATSQIRVLLADDHYLVRSGIRALLEAIPNVSVVGEAGNGREVLDWLAKEPTDLVFLDISMPGLNGLDALERMKKEFPAVRVIVLSMHQIQEYALKAISLGASGYLLKRDGVAELRGAIKAV